MKKALFFFSLFFIELNLIAQVGGKNVYKILDFSYSSRIAALGGGLVSVFDNDPSLLMYNPSYISKEHNNTLHFNITDYFINTAYGSALYSHTFRKAGSFAVEMRYIGYGSFQETDIYGNETGKFSANDYALSIGWGRWLSSNFSIGASLRTILSNYESYTSFGLAADLAGSYFNPERKISLTLLFKNMGSEIKPYTSGNFEKLPFDIQLAFSQKFEHLPVRYHISLHHLYTWKMRYIGDDDPVLEQDISNGIKYPSKTALFFDNLFRHFIFGIEIEPIKYFSLFGSYNHNRRQEMKIPQKSTIAGFSYGFTVNFYSVKLGFSRSHFASGITPNYFNISFNINELNDLTKKNKNKKLERLN